MQTDVKAHTKSELNVLIHRAAIKYDISERVLTNLVKTESNFNDTVTNSYGAKGLCQLKWYHFKKGENWRNPQDNLDACCRLLKLNLARFNGDWHRSLSAYNMGETWVVSRGIYRSRYSNTILGGK